MEAERWSYDESIYDTLLELWALKWYITILEVELPRVVDDEKQRIRRELKGADDRDVYSADIGGVSARRGNYNETPNGNSARRNLGTFESAVKRAAETLRRSKKIESSLKGNGSPAKARKYFERELNFELLPPGIDFSLIEDFYSLRNAIAHANGRLDDIRPDARTRIERLANTSPGLKISHDGYLIVSIEFVSRAFKFIEPLLLDLAERTDRERTRKKSV